MTVAPLSNLPPQQRHIDTPQLVLEILNGSEELSPTERMAYLECSANAQLTTDESAEILYHILREKSCLHGTPDDLSADMARLMALPYSPLANAYKELGRFCHDGYLLNHREDLTGHAVSELYARIQAAEERLKARSVFGPAIERYAYETSRLRTSIEMQLRCPLLQLVRKSVRKTLDFFALTQVNALFLTLKTGESQVRLACVPRGFLSYTPLDHQIIAFWFANQPQGLLTYEMEIISLSNLTQMDMGMMILP